MPLPAPDSPRLQPAHRSASAVGLRSKAAERCDRGPFSGIATLPVGYPERAGQSMPSYAFPGLCSYRPSKSVVDVLIIFLARKRAKVLVALPERDIDLSKNRLAGVEQQL